MHIINSEKYVSPRERPLTPEEKMVRRMAYALKVPTTQSFDLAGRVMMPHGDTRLIVP